MLLMGMTWLFVSFAGITSSVLAANTVPVFCSRMRQDIRKISTALETGTPTCPEESFSLLLLLSKPTFVSISAKQQKFGRPLTETCYRTVGAVAETSWRALSSWKPDLIFFMFPGVPHACCFARLLFFFFFPQSSFLALRGVHDPDQTSGMHV